MNTAVVVVFACLIVVAVTDDRPALFRSEVRDHAGQFSLSYQSPDGTTFTEQGSLRPTNDGKDHVLVKQGSYSYISPEGQPISVRYSSDEYGFRAEGDHLPVAPIA